MLNKAFSPEEQTRLLAAPNILADFFKRAGDVGFTVAAEQIRATYWEIETHATRLRRMAKGWTDAEPFCNLSHDAKNVLNKAADELDRLTKLCVRRPISELRQEAFGKGRESGPDRWVVGWWTPDNSHGQGQWRCMVMRRVDPSLWLDDINRPIAMAPTHFSELPSDETP